MGRRGVLLWLLGMAVFVLLTTAGRFLGLYIDWLWFQEMQFTSVFVTILRTEVLLGVVAGLACFVLLYGNVMLARWLAPRDALVAVDALLNLPSPVLLVPLLRRLALPVCLFLALLVGWRGTGHWELVLKALHATPFGFRDPLFDQEVAFYVFQLPFWNALYGWLMGVLFLTPSMGSTAR